MATKIIDDLDGKRALESFQREIITTADGGGTVLSPGGPTGRKELLERALLGTLEWKNYRDGPRVPPLPTADVIRSGFLAKCMDGSFTSLSTGKALIALPSISPLLAVLDHLGRREAFEHVLGAFRANGDAAVTFNSAELGAISKYVAGYGYRNVDDRFQDGGRV